MIEIEARLDELKALGLHRRTRLVSGPQGPHVLLDGKPVLLLCSNNYLGLADHPRVREAAGGCGDALGRRRRRLAAGVGDDDDPPPARGAARRVQGTRGGAAVRLGLPRQHRRRSPRSRGPGTSIFSDELNHASIIDGCRLSRAEVFVYDHCDVEHLAWGIERGRGTRRPDRHRQRLLDGRRRRAAGGDRRARHDHGIRLLVDEAHGTGHARARRARRARGGRARGRGRRDRRHARQGARLVRGVRRLRPPAWRGIWSTRRGRSSSRPRCRRRRSPARWRRSSCSRSGRGCVDKLQANAARAPRHALAQRGLRRPRLEHADRPARRRRGGAGDADLRGGARARRVRPGDQAADGAAGHLAAAAGGDGIPSRGGAPSRGADARPGRAGRRGVSSRPDAGVPPLDGR